LISIRGGVGVGVSHWFDDHIRREVGTHTLFGWDPWIDGVVLRSTFNRLFDLGVNKMTTVADMLPLGWGEDGGAWEWRRRLLAWEEEQVRECSEILSYIVLRPNHLNMWLWNLHTSKKYNVTSGYNYMLSTVNIMASDHIHSIWNKEVPLKVIPFACRLL